MTESNSGKSLTVSVLEAARMIGISRNSAYAMVHSGQLPALRVGLLYRIPITAIDELLETGVRNSSEQRATTLGYKLRRFTPEEDAIIEQDYLAYVPTEEIAARLDRDVGTLRQRILALGLRRSGNVSQLLHWAPAHLKERVQEMDPDEWIAECHAWREDETNKLTEATAKEKDELYAARMTQASEIDARNDLSRNQKIKAMRMAGLTLEEVGVRFNLTRERVRQITDPNFIAPTKLRPRVSAVQKMAKWTEQVERERKMLIGHALSELNAVWAACPQEARDEFLRMVAQEPKT